MVGSVRPKAASFAIVATGTHADVRLSPRAKGEFDKINAATHELAIKQARELERFMGRFCNFPKPNLGDEKYKPNLGDEKYKKEGDFSDGSGGKVAVYVFKPFKWRLYGAVLNVKGRKCFVGVRPRQKAR